MYRSFIVVYEAGSYLRAESIIGILFIDLFTGLIEEYPNLKFEFYDRAQVEKIRQITEKRIVDFVIDMDYNCKKYGFQTIDLFEHGHTFLATKSFLETNGLSDVITVEQLMEFPVVGHYVALERFTNETGIKIKPSISTSLSETVLPFIKSGRLIGYWIDGLIEKLNDSDIVKITLKDVNLPKLRLCLGYNKGSLSQAAQMVVDRIIQHLKAMPFGQLLI